MYRVLRHFSITSLASIVLATVLITLLYRHMAITGIMHFSEKINLDVAHTALNPIESQLMDYLTLMANVDKSGEGLRRLNSLALEHVAQEVMEDIEVVRIKIYNQHGIVVFSSNPTDFGRSTLELGDRDETTGFQSAIKGKVTHKLIYRDSFNLFAPATDADNLMQTYVPLRRTLTAPVLGVIEVYTDVTPLVDYAQYMQIALAGVATIIMALLYLTLLAIVRRADKVITTQQGTIRERTEMLELLSAQLLTAQENEKKRLAVELNEDIAQTLSAVKFQVEHAVQVAGRQSTTENATSLSPAVSAIQDAIRKVSTMAMDLRPPSLDDLGVVATVDWYFRRFQARHPEILLKSEIDIREHEVSRALKVIIYRIVQEMLENLARHALASLVSVRLDKSNHAITLTVEDNGRLYQPGEAASGMKDGKRIWLYAIEERAILAGGTVVTENNTAGGYRTLFRWEPGV